MRTFLLTIFFLIFSELSPAQSLDWMWAKTNTGNYDDYGTSVINDNAGNSYIIGSFYSPTITLGTTTLTNTQSGYSDVFISKYDANGNVSWTKKIGGNINDAGSSIAVDNSGNVFVLGTFHSSSVSVAGTYTLTNTSTDSSSDVFIAKLNSSGTTLWAKKINGTSYDYGTGIAVDNSGNSFIVGTFYSSSITLGTTTLTNTQNGYSDVFVAKYDASGNVSWAKKAGGNIYDAGTGIAVDNSGNIFVTGNFQSGTMAFDATTLYNSASDSTADIFISKLNASGTVLWAVNLFGSSNDYVQSVSVDKSGNFYIAGYFYSSEIYYYTRLINSGGSGYSDAFLAKFDNDGYELFATSCGGYYDDFANDICVDKFNNCFVVGTFYSPSLTFGNLNLSNSGSGYADIFLAKYDTYGNIMYAKSNNGNYDDYGNSISCDTLGNNFLTGSYYSSTNTFGTTVLSNSAAGYSDLFLGKFFDFNVNIANKEILAQSIQTISWNTNTSVTALTIAFSSDSGASWIPIVNSYSTSIGSYNWNVPNLNQPVSHCLLKISNANDGAKSVTYNFLITYLLSPKILFVKDVPLDQGGKVFLKWRCSKLDTNENYLTGYTLWKSVPDILQAHNPAEKIRMKMLNNVLYTWIYVETIPAHGFTEYAYDIPTLYDSMSTTNGKHYFFVSAQTYDASIFYDSEIDSGYSIDNLSPSLPQNLHSEITNGTITLSWQRNLENDLKEYAVYYSSTENFMDTTLYATTNYTTMEIPSANFLGETFFKISAIDVHNNESPFSQSVSVFNDTMMFRTFNAIPSIAEKPGKLKAKKSSGATYYIISGTANMATAVANVFEKLGKNGSTFLGIPLSDALAKTHGWILYKSASAFRKMFSEPHTENYFPISYYKIVMNSDSTINTKKSKRLAKAINANRKTFNNIAWEQSIVFNLNLIASEQNVTPKEFGNLVVDTSIAFMGRELRGLTLIEVGRFLDSAMTFWNELGVDTLDRDSEIKNIINNLIKPINEGFATDFATGNFFYDTVGLAIEKNPYAVMLDGATTTRSVGLVKRDFSRKQVYSFHHQRIAEIPVVKNFPNPFNPLTTIHYTLSTPALVSMKVYNVLGQEIATLLHNEAKEEGTHEIQFDATHLSSGIYFYTLTTENFSATKKMVLMK